MEDLARTTGNQSNAETAVGSKSVRFFKEKSSFSEKA